jgi:hypothetical protein
MIFVDNKLDFSAQRFERITRYNLGFARIGNTLKTVGSFLNNS